MISAPSSSFLFITVLSVQVVNGNKSPLESAFPCAIRALKHEYFNWIYNVWLGHGCDSEKKKKINERRAIPKNIRAQGITTIISSKITRKKNIEDEP